MEEEEIIYNKSDDEETVGEESEEEALQDEQIANSNRPNIKQIINSVKKSIYDTLFNYFDTPPDAALLASLLDPWFKKMRGWLEEEQEQAIALLKLEYQLLRGKELLVINQRSNRTDTAGNYSTAGGFKSRLFGDEEDEEVDNDDEVKCYINRIRTSQANRNVDPFQ
jgi:hypothetical protein